MLNVLAAQRSDTRTWDQTDFFGVGGVDPLQLRSALFQLRLDLVFVAADLSYGGEDQKVSSFQMVKDHQHHLIILI